MTLVRGPELHITVVAGFEDAPGLSRELELVKAHLWA